MKFLVLNKIDKINFSLSIPEEEKIILNNVSMFFDFSKYHPNDKAILYDLISDYILIQQKDISYENIRKQ